MKTPGLRRPLDAWRSLVALVGAMTTPGADVAGCDASAEELASDSRIAQALSASVAACGRAAAYSAAVAAWRRWVPVLVPEPLAQRVRAISCIAAAAAGTTLILRIAGTGTEPLTWMLPAAVGALALAGIAGAEAIARAIANYHS